MFPASLVNKASVIIERNCFGSVEVSSVRAGYIVAVIVICFTSVLILFMQTCMILLYCWL